MTEIEETVERVSHEILQEAYRTGGVYLSLGVGKACARAAIAAMPSPWRTIDSAPKDGTWILVGAVNLYPCDAHWATDPVGDTWDWMDGFGRFAAQPTHWQPLPPLPEA